MKRDIDNKKDNVVNQLNNKKKKNFKSQSKNNKEEINHINNFTSSKEKGEDATQYGEFVSSFFGWISPEEQKEQTHKLENITKENNR